MKKFKLVITLLFAYTLVSAQVGEIDSSYQSKSNLGFGMGIDYGGFGGRFAFHATNNFALFGGLGYNLNGLGYNLGAYLRLAPDKKVCPNIIAMYGYNAVIKVSGAANYNQTYYGPSVGIGLEINTRNPKVFYNIELFFPVRSQEYKDDLQALKDDPNIEFKNEPFPITFSLGYHIKF